MSIQYLILSVDQLRFAIAAYQVQEIVALPALSPLAGAPAYIAGIFQLRGTLVPVVDLLVRLERKPIQYRLSDQVVILNTPTSPIAIIASGTHDVLEISPREIEAVESLRLPPGTQHRMITGLARVDSEVLMCLDPDSVMQVTGDDQLLESLLVQIGESIPEPYSAEEERGSPFLTRTLPQEREIFRERAREHALSAHEQEQESQGRTPYAVIGLDEECFGIKLDVVREFLEIRAITPIPGTPPHLLGLAHHRGEIITVVDIRQNLGQSGASSWKSGMAILIQSGEILVGLVADEIHDVLYLRPEEIGRPGYSSESESEKHLQGTARHGQRIIGLIDFAALLSSGRLDVDVA